MKSEHENSADPFSENHDPTGNWFRFLSINWKSKDIVVFKYLLSKMLYTEEQLSEEDVTVLFTVWERVVEKVAVDEGYKEAYFWLIFLTRNCFKNLSAFAVDKQAILQMRNELCSFFSHGRKQLGASIYYGGKKDYHCQLKYGEPLIPKAKNRIGVGYRDKGNAKNSALDGSPSWQEVATDEWFQLHKPSDSTGCQKVEQMFEDLKVGEHYSWQSNKSYSPPSTLVKRMKG